MWITIIPAIVGLAGVLVGAVITAGANYLLTVRKAKAEEAKDKLSRAVELTTSARLIEREFFVAYNFSKFLVEDKLQVPEIKFPLDAWERDKGVVARELPLRDWNADTSGHSQ